MPTFNDERLQLRIANEKYLRSHPVVSDIMHLMVHSAATLIGTASGVQPTSTELCQELAKLGVSNDLKEKVEAWKSQRHSEHAGHAYLTDRTLDDLMADGAKK